MTFRLILKCDAALEGCESLPRDNSTWFRLLGVTTAAQVASEVGALLAEARDGGWEKRGKRWICKPCCRRLDSLTSDRPIDASRLPPVRAVSS